VGAYSGLAVANYVFGVRTWHTLHGASWLINKVEIAAALDGASALAPTSLKLPKHLPFTPDLLIHIQSALDLTSPLDAAVFACLTTTFWSMAQLGEFTVPTLKSYSLLKHISHHRVREETDRNRLRVFRFSLPWTKVSTTGEDVCWGRQDGLADPLEAIQTHFRVNNPPSGAALFSWCHSSGIRPLTRSAFTKQVDEIIISLDLPKMHFHGLCIGSVLEYLLCNTPFDVVKIMGRWSSNSFSLYLHNHAVILAPYVQNTPLMEQFSRITMPPVC